MFLADRRAAAGFPAPPGFAHGIPAEADLGASRRFLAGWEGVTVITVMSVVLVMAAVVGLTIAGVGSGYIHL
ncbi:hypothetical protein ACFWAR_02785 [Streptomyces sp. NPDC059917]|uniref:hypothetical protein n=1 Tax=Streptomyces sp. NPDC059917 TaxID=3347002 RepID=UPI0036529F61